MTDYCISWNLEEAYSNLESAIRDAIRIMRDPTVAQSFEVYTDTRCYNVTMLPDGTIEIIGESTA